MVSNRANPEKQFLKNDQGLDNTIVEDADTIPYTPARALSISGLKSRVLKLTFLA